MGRRGEGSTTVPVGRTCVRLKRVRRTDCLIRTQHKMESYQSPSFLILIKKSNLYSLRYTSSMRNVTPHRTGERSDLSHNVETKEEGQPLYKSQW